MACTACQNSNGKPTGLCSGCNGGGCYTCSEKDKIKGTWTGKNRVKKGTCQSCLGKKQ